MAARQSLLAALLFLAVTAGAATNCDTGPNSLNTNPCFSAGGDSFVCCPGGCSDAPQAKAACPAIGGSNTLPGTPTLQFIEYANEATQTIVGDPTGPGAVLKFRNEVRDLNNMTIGYTLGTCAYSVGVQADGTFEGICFYGIHLGPDSLTAVGKLTSANVADLGLTGGTGIYSGANGRIVLTTLMAEGQSGGSFGQFLYQIYTVAPNPFPQPNTARYSRDQLLAIGGIPPVPPSTQGSPTFEILETQASAASASFSSLFVFRNNVFRPTNNATAAGFDIGTCTYETGPLADGTFELLCTDSFHLGSDFFVLYGLYTVGDTQVVAVMGGAGQFEKVKGSVEVTTLSGSGTSAGSFSYKFFLK